MNFTIYQVEKFFSEHFGKPYKFDGNRFTPTQQYKRGDLFRFKEHPDILLLCSVRMNEMCLVSLYDNGNRWADYIRCGNTIYPTIEEMKRMIGETRRLEDLEYLGNMKDFSDKITKLILEH